MGRIEWLCIRILKTAGNARYTMEGKALGLDLVNQPELLELPDYTVNAANNFWK